MKKFCFYLLFGIFMLTCVDAICKPQSKACDDSDYPICATNGTHWYLFKNECRLNTENVKREQNGDPTLQKTEIANCFKRCDQVCTDEYAPICARSTVSQRTFQNRCQLDLENCRNGNIWMLLHEGECPPTPIPPTCGIQCPTFCPLEYDPICATFGDIDQTFQNLCYLQADICASGRGWQIKNEGECEVPQPDCNQACPKIFSPMCASFNGENRTFANECLLDSEICTTGNQWCILHKGECIKPTQTCPTVCPEIFEPVCASHNGELRTFTNKCFVNVEACTKREEWTIEYTGECLPPPRRCPQRCTFIYQPVCATANGVTTTFPNQCVLDALACRTGENWVVVNEGECALSSSPSPLPQPIPPPPRLSPQLSPTYSLPSPRIPPQTPPPQPSPPQTQSSPMLPPQTPPSPSQTQSSPMLPPQMPPSSSQTQSSPFLQPQTPPSPSQTQLSPMLPPQMPPPALPPAQTQPSPQVPPQTPPSRCPEVCPALYVPLCAGFQSSQRTFTNVCELGAEICRTGQNWQILYDGQCDTEGNSASPGSPAGPTGPAGPAQGSNVCPANYDPICATFNGELRTFSNQCQLDAEIFTTNQEWVMLYEGECRVSDQPRNCPNICPITYEPVCATFNGIKRTFPNECELNHEAYRTDTPWVILSSGECDYCPVCSDLNDPVCAEFNGQVQTFDNACKMEYENCKNGSAWKIVSKNSCDCPTLCPTILDDPICATSSNGESRVFDSICQMNMEACRTNTDWQVLHAGPCSEPTAPRRISSDQLRSLSADPQFRAAFMNYLRSTGGNSNPTEILEQPSVNSDQLGTYSSNPQLPAAFVSYLQSSRVSSNSYSAPEVIQQPSVTPDQLRALSANPQFRAAFISYLQSTGPNSNSYSGPEQPSVNYNQPGTDSSNIQLPTEFVDYLQSSRVNSNSCSGPEVIQQPSLTPDQLRALSANPQFRAAFISYLQSNGANSNSYSAPEQPSVDYNQPGTDSSNIQLPTAFVSYLQSSRVSSNSYSAPEVIQQPSLTPDQLRALSANPQFRAAFISYLQSTGANSNSYSAPEQPSVDYNQPGTDSSNIQLPTEFVSYLQSTRVNSNSCSAPEVIQQPSLTPDQLRALSANPLFRDAFINYLQSISANSNTYPAPEAIQQPLLNSDQLRSLSADPQFRAAFLSYLRSRTGQNDPNTPHEMVVETAIDPLLEPAPVQPSY